MVPDHPLYRILIPDLHYNPHIIQLSLTYWLYDSLLEDTIPPTSSTLLVSTCVYSWKIPSHSQQFVLPKFLGILPRSHKPALQSFLPFLSPDSSSFRKYIITFLHPYFIISPHSLWIIPGRCHSRRTIHPVSPCSCGTFLEYTILPIQPTPFLSSSGPL